MDTSGTYIKMCENAVEIQKTWLPAEGDYAYVHSSMVEGSMLLFEGLGPLIVTRMYEEDVFFEREKSFWLPRQDQLQEMVPESVDGMNSLIRFIGWYWALNISTVWSPLEDFDFRSGSLTEHFKKRKRKAEQLLSMEQLWLAFVMKEKYGKTWNGESWAKDQEEDDITTQQIEDTIRLLDDADVPKDNRMYWNPDTNKVEPVR